MTLHPALPLPFGKRPFMDGYRTRPEEDLRDFLLIYVELLAKLGVAPERNFHAMVAAEGAWYDPQMLPRDVEVMQCKFCFDNAQEMALRRPDLVYCEGFATAAFPLHHAWLINEQGTVVDPTWADTSFVHGSAYLGIPIARNFLRQYRQECLAIKGGEISLLDNANKNWSFLHRTDLDYMATPADFQPYYSDQPTAQANLPGPAQELHTL